MDKAIYALIGIITGFLLTALKDWLVSHRRNKRDRDYLATRIVCLLDRFVYDCTDVVGDDGLRYGQPDKDGLRRVQVALPNFAPDQLDVNWKSIPPKIMYSILSIPSTIYSTNRKIASAFEHAASPPDFEEGFFERQYQYSKLGLKASEIAQELRKLCKLPDSAYQNWNPVEYLRSANSGFEQDLKDLEERHKQRAQQGV